MATQHDTLGLGNNQNVKKMLDKLGTNFPDNEKVLLSEKVFEINERNKKHERVLLITDKAIYNLLTTNYSKCRRRIDISRVVAVTSSETR